MGAWREGRKICFRTWAPEHRSLEVILNEKTFAMAPQPEGYFYTECDLEHSPPLYKFRIDGKGPFPDPWSRAQPLGIHGPSSLPSDSFVWTDSQWKGLQHNRGVIYEVHVGTATAEGTFDALAERIPDLAALGISAIELMPLSSFSGTRNWGYDGVAHFSPAEVYGGPEGLRRFVDAAHRASLGVIIDVVYNHFGPEGNYLPQFSQAYFTSQHHTPWGDAVNYSLPIVREFALRNAEMWVVDYHADGLRLDATHTLIDESETHLLSELVQRSRATASGKHLVIVAEDERNERQLITPREQGGAGLDAVWADDLHHQLRRAFAGDSEGYYKDYTGSVSDIVATLISGWFYQGQHSQNMNQPRGTRADDLSPSSFIHCIQNHDQIGNRPLGTRLSKDVDAEAFRAMSALLLLSPYTPMLFAGQEWNSQQPFLYFTDHGEGLGHLVTEGRRKEFSGFSQFAGLEIPDPQAPETFKTSKLNWSERASPAHAGVLLLYKELIALRTFHPALRDIDRRNFDARTLSENCFLLERTSPLTTLRLIVNIRGKFQYPLEGRWAIRLHTEEERFGGKSNQPPHRDRLQLEGPSAVLLESV